MFCPKCGALIGKKRTPLGVVEFCRCPDRLEKDIPEYKTPMKKEKIKIIRPRRSQAHKITPKRAQSLESLNIEKKIRQPSDYAKLSLENKILAESWLPPTWNQGKVGLSLEKNLNEKYERFYRKFEDFFLSINSELKFYIFLVPISSMTEFKVIQWGIGALEIDNGMNLLKWYQGNNLKLDWKAKIREKEESFLAPYRFFPNKYQTIEFKKINYLTQRQLFDKVLNQWNLFKEIDDKRKFRTPSHEELYDYWRTIK